MYVLEEWCSFLIPIFFEDGVCSLHVVEHEVFVLGLFVQNEDDGVFPWLIS